MFDDIPNQGQAGSVPPNLPTGEPEDIFSNVPSEAATDPQPLPPPVPANSGTVPETVDTKTALSAGVLQPKEPSTFDSGAPVSAPPAPPAPTPVYNSPIPDVPSAPATQIPPQAPRPPQMETHTMPGDAPEMYSLREPKASKGIITVIIVVIVLLILGGGGLFIYNQFIAGSSTDIPNAIEDNTTVGDIVDPFASETSTTDDLNTVGTTEDDTSSGTTINQPISSEDDVLFGEESDLDADGLTDVREQGIGTDPAHWDSDGDDLSDGDEVIIWKTDPLNPDTDGDGFKDGEEIKNGYSPSGPGKIFEPPTSAPTNTQ